ncbi:MAG TPA: EamA family transporter [Ktedonobacterales bacterium]
MWNWAIGVRGVGYVTVYTYAVPIAGGIVAWILLGEALTLPQIGAGAVVIAGMLAARWGASRVIGRAGAAALPGAGAAASDRPREQGVSSV